MLKKAGAATAAVVGLTLTATGVFAATPAAAPTEAHGTLSIVARDRAAVGGAQDNHGGAVSTIARGSHGSDAKHGKGDGKGSGKS